ncbi:hypothetical protein ACVIW0_003976 [Bradyrhizobium sp. USDA 4454]
MSRPVANPGCGWPLEMRAETAAAYVDEPSVDAFLSKVASGLYSQPSRVKGALPKWHRAKLDHDVARRHGLRCDAPALAENAEDLV